MNEIKNCIKEQFKSFAPPVAIAIAITFFAIVAANLLYRQKQITKRGFEFDVSVGDKSIAKKEEKVVDFAALMKLANVDRGAKIFKKCASCHSAEHNGGNKVGPNLFGVVGRARGSVTGFAYSDAMKAKGGAWDRESINQFITKPKDFISGTKMAFPGLKKPQDKADVILYLEKADK